MPKSQSRNDLKLQYNRTAQNCGAPMKPQPNSPLNPTKTSAENATETAGTRNGQEKVLQKPEGIFPNKFQGEFTSNAGQKCKN